MLERLKRLNRGWWAVLFIFCLGIWIQANGYNTGFVITAGNWDEKRMYLDMLYRLEGGPALEKQTLVGYPPLIFWLYEAAHRLTADPSASLFQPHTPETVALLKLWAVGINMLTALWLVLAGRLLGGWKYGLIAALIWIVLPSVIDRTVVGLTEAWQACAVTGAAYFALRALARGDRWAAVASTALALIAFLFKYSIFPVFGLGFVATLWNGWRQPRRWVVPLGFQLLIVALALGILSTGLRTNGNILMQKDSETYNFLNGNFLTYLTYWSRTAYVWRSTAGQLRLRPYDFSLFVAVILALVAVVTARTTWKRLGLVLIGGLVLVHLTLINIYLIHEEIVQRYTAPVSGLLVLIIVTTVGWLTQRFTPPSKRQLKNMLLALFTMLWFGVAFTRSYKFMVTSSQPNSLERYQQWVENTIPINGSLLIRSSDWWIFEQRYWDYPTNHLLYEGPFTKMTRAGWLDKGILYATLTQADLDTVQSQDARDLTNMTLLKDFPPSGNESQELFVYYLPTLQTPAEGTVTFDNGLTLHGCRLKDESHEGQKRLGVQCFWQASQVQTQTWKLYLHLVSPDSRVPLAQADGLLTLPTRPPDTWTDPEEILIGQLYIIDIPQDLEISSLRLLAGIYDESTGIRALQNGSDYVEFPLASILQTDLTLSPTLPKISLQSAALTLK